MIHSTSIGRLLCLLAVAALPAPAQAPTPERIRSLMGQIAQITGFEIKRPVPYEILSRAAWKRHIEEEIQRQVKPEEIRTGQLTLQLFGLVPRDFDLKQATIELLAEQAAAVYDHRRKKMLFLEDGTAGAMQEAVLVHELAHALADRHFSMQRFLDKGAKTDEDQAARLAVVEGQAMWIMLEWQLGQMGGGSLAGNRAALERMLPAMGKLAESSYPVFAKAPLYMRETLLFPYTAGLLFQQAAVEKHGRRAFAEVLARPPATTHEVLHPEEWIEERRYAAPALPPLPGAAQYRSASSGTLGELDIGILWKQYGTEEEAARWPALWRGGAYELAEHKQTRRAALRWSVQLATPEAARQFLALYRKVLEGKSDRLAFQPGGPETLAGRNADGWFRVEAHGASVTALEAMQP